MNIVKSGITITITRLTQSQFTNAYKKWCNVFFPNQDKRFVNIDVRTLGAMMRSFREKTNRTKTELGKILGVDRTTICFYEEGKRMPSINYLYHFVSIFKFQWMKLFLGVSSNKTSKRYTFSIKSVKIC